MLLCLLQSRGGPGSDRSCWLRGYLPLCGRGPRVVWGAPHLPPRPQRHFWPQLWPLVPQQVALRPQQPSAELLHSGTLFGGIFMFIKMLPLCKSGPTSQLVLIVFFDAAYFHQWMRRKWPNGKFHFNPFLFRVRCMRLELEALGRRRRSAYAAPS